MDSALSCRRSSARFASVALTCSITDSTNSPTLPPRPSWRRVAATVTNLRPPTSSETRRPSTPFATEREDGARMREARKGARVGGEGTMVESGEERGRTVRGGVSTKGGM